MNSFCQTMNAVDCDAQLYLSTVRRLAKWWRTLA